MILDSVKKGDKVVISWGFNEERVCTVERTTKRNIFLEGRGFKRLTGKLIGPKNFYFGKILRKIS